MFYSGIEKRHLVRLITLRRPFDSASRNNEIFVGVAQLVEHGTHKPGVAGALPAADTKKIDSLKLYNFMYNEMGTSELFLKRKKDVFEKYIELRL